MRQRAALGKRTMRSVGCLMSRRNAGCKFAGNYIGRETPDVEHRLLTTSGLGE